MPQPRTDTPQTDPAAVPARGLLRLLFARSRRDSAPSPAAAQSLNPAADGPYEKRPLLTPAQARFFHALQLVVGNAYHVYPKVNLAHILRVRRDKPQAWLSKIECKHANYALVHPDTLATVAVIQLDDAANPEPHDTFKAQALHAAELPLIRLRARHSYRVQDLRAELMAELKKTGE